MTNSKRILIVEDDEPFRRMLGKQLRLHEEFVSLRGQVPPQPPRTSPSRS